MRKQLLGSEHPDVAQSLNNLAGLYDSQGRYAEAEPLFTEAVTILISQLGQDHPHTQTVQQNYLMFLQKVALENRQGELSNERGYSGGTPKKEKKKSKKNKGFGSFNL